MAPLAAQASAPASRLGKRARAQNALAIIVGAALGGAIVGAGGRMARPMEPGGARRTDGRGGRWNRRARDRRCRGRRLRAGHLAQPAARRGPDGCVLWTGGICPDYLRTAACRRHTARDCQAGARLADFPHAAGAVARRARLRPVTRTLLGTGEGAVFGLGLALGLTRRASSRTSHETVTAH